MVCSGMRGNMEGKTEQQMHCCIEQLQGKLIYTRNTLVNAIRKRCAVMNTIDPFSFVVCSISKVMGIV